MYMAAMPVIFTGISEILSLFTTGISRQLLLRHNRKSCHGFGVAGIISAPLDHVESKVHLTGQLKFTSTAHSGH